MPELLILIAGGLLLGTILPAPADVRPAWTRRVASIALFLLGAGAITAAVLPRAPVDLPAFYRRVQTGLVLASVAAAIAYRFAVRFDDARRARRTIGGTAFALAVLAGSNLLHETMVPRGTAVAVPPKALSLILQTFACAGAAAVPGVAFAFALFPLWGVTEPVQSARSFRRLHRALLAILSFRAVVSVGGMLAFTPRVVEAATQADAAHVNPGLLAARWLLGLVAPAAFAWFGYRLAARGRALGAAAALLVGALSAMNGEHLALALVRDTGLPY